MSAPGKPEHVGARERLVAVSHRVAPEPVAGLAQDWYMAGEAALQRRDLREAEDAFGRAVLADPSHANALFRLGQLAESRHEVQAATKRFHDALAANPGHTRALEHLAALAAKRPLAPAPPARAEGPPTRPSGTGIVGTVQNYQQRSEQNLNRRSIFVLTFRVEQRRGGERGPLIPVEMRGPELHGSIANGDWVELPADWKPQRVQLKRLSNLTTGQVVRMGGRGSHRSPILRILAGILMMIAVLWVIAIIGLVVAGFLGVDIQQLIDHAKQALDNSGR